MSFTVPQIDFRPKASEAAIVVEQNTRFTVITSRLIRMEHSARGVFEDRPSQAFWYREQPVPSYAVRRENGWLSIDTGDLLLRYLPGELGFTRDSLTILVRATDTTWHYGDKNYQNLKGTGRTLDGWDGPIELEEGLLSRAGWAIVDDSKSLVFDAQGWLEARQLEAEEYDQDLYMFGYGHDYTTCLQDFFKVAGKVPMVPRWILGNWWSRYWEYTQQELGELMVKFAEKEVPLSVCIIDMDWHITKTGNESSGWTGYTWNRDLFPDPKGFIGWLHEEMGLRTGMNLHPADGVWPHEEMYPQLAQKMGIDPTSCQPVYFDIADPNFAKNYFEILHHPYEADGVDFWWMDWQQGARITHSKHPLARKLDPLWWLNHLHYHDLGRDGNNRSFIFSRWGGLGNHRYPIGFSGDSVVSWKSLAFQPSFTSTAANVGFGWWSHDIGGHMFGIEDGELYARWVQFGVFSPVMRLHCTKNPYQDRAPWAFGEDVFRVVKAAMQLRHALIPYLYSSAWLFTQQGLPLSTPMYYYHPESAEAYECPNQYMFGEQLLAAPFVSPVDPDTRMAKTSVWLPDGDWYNMFDGELLQGDRWVNLYGSLEVVPIFAKAGAIIPMAPLSGKNGAENPAELVLNVFPGDDGAFELYEDAGDNGRYLQGEYSLLKLDQSWQPTKQVIQIHPVEGELSHLPASRGVTLKLFGIQPGANIRCSVNNEILPCAVMANSDGLLVEGIMISPADHVTIEVSAGGQALAYTPDRRAGKVRAMLREFHLASRVKQAIDGDLPAILQNTNRLLRYQQELTDSQLSALQDQL